jgi:predicted deacetylase
VLLATNKNTSRSVTIQCKTTRNPKAKSWIISEKCEKFFSKNHFYVFLVLRGISEMPKFYIVPSRIVAARSRQRHREWTKHLKRDGTKRKTNSMRIFDDKKESYLGRWELLGL